MAAKKKHRDRCTVNPNPTSTLIPECCLHIQSSAARQGLSPASHFMNRSQSLAGMMASSAETPRSYLFFQHRVPGDEWTKLFDSLPKCARTRLPPRWALATGADAIRRPEIEHHPHMALGRPALSSHTLLFPHVSSEIMPPPHAILTDTAFKFVVGFGLTGGAIWKVWHHMGADDYDHKMLGNGVNAPEQAKEAERCVPPVVAGLQCSPWAARLQTLKNR